MREDPKSETIGKENTVIAPERIQEKPNTGTVVAVGPGRVLENGERAPMDCEVGDKILYKAMSGMRVVHLDEEMTLIREDELLGAFEQ